MLPLSPKQTLVWNLEKHFVNPVLEAGACGWSLDTWLWAHHLAHIRCRFVQERREGPSHTKTLDI